MDGVTGELTVFFIALFLVPLIAHVTIKKYWVAIIVPILTIYPCGLIVGWDRIEPSIFEVLAHIFVIGMITTVSVCMGIPFAIYRNRKTATRFLKSPWAISPVTRNDDIE